MPAKTGISLVVEDHMRAIGHFIGGKEVQGKSGRTADVFEPMTGDVQAKVALASKAEVRAAVENARAAQPEWAATNPQRRARVMMKFLELAQRDYDKLAELLAREHGKTVPDAKGDIQRGLEVVEFAIGVPHLLKGEYTEGAGPGIDIYSLRQPLGVVAGITPFNFPAMIPMWKFAPAIACGNAFILKPACRRASSMSSTATRKRSTPSSTTPTSRRSALSAPRRSRNISMNVRPRAANAASALAAPRTMPSSCPTPTWTRPSMP
jgi:delta 1-pyrroline-5-carboxylate dehydrogenase